MKVLVEDVLGPQLVGEDPTRVEFLWEKLYSASRLPLALAHDGRGLKHVRFARPTASGRKRSAPDRYGDIDDRLPEHAAAVCQVCQLNARRLVGRR
jgi:hypothetical protein